MKEDEVTRRSFVAGTAGAAFGAMVVPRRVLGGAGYLAPSETVNVAVVGCGGQGAADATEIVAGGHNIVALADVDFGFVDSTMPGRVRGRNGQPNQAGIKLQEAYGKAKRYADYRKMLEEQKDIDGVVIATPDHTHAIIAKAAMELGKHVYVEKPLTWSVHEARVLRETAQRTKVVTQMGNQGHSSDGAALINEWIHAGVIGPVKEVLVWTNRPIWPQGIPRPGKPAADRAGTRGGGGGFGNHWTSRRLNESIATAINGGETPPPSLNWDLFLGPAPEVPFHPIYHPFNWRGWLDWGTGALGDMGAHLIDHPYWALGLKYPSSIEATSTPWGMDSKNQPASYPLAMNAVYHFPARLAAAGEDDLVRRRADARTPRRAAGERDARPRRRRHFDRRERHPPSRNVWRQTQAVPCVADGGSAARAEDPSANPDRGRTQEVGAAPDQLGRCDPRTLEDHVSVRVCRAADRDHVAGSGRTPHGPGQAHRLRRGSR